LGVNGVDGALLANFLDHWPEVLAEKLHEGLLILYIWRFLHCLVDLGNQFGILDQTCQSLNIQFQWIDETYDLAYLFPQQIFRDQGGFTLHYRVLGLNLGFCS
jgi:hypothetical protein